MKKDNFLFQLAASFVAMVLLSLAVKLVGLENVTVVTLSVLVGRGVTQDYDKRKEQQ